ncbi:hypothetical protein [Streptomyces sp. DW26H14]|uniref:hypothetical protein n=1 Tax=Streptomyces sp. DW26H14 TaxID=3435395 RepID=UPI00403D7648
MASSPSPSASTPLSFPKSRSLSSVAARFTRRRPPYVAALAPLLGFVVLLAAVFAVAFVTGSASGPAAPGWHRTDRTPTSPGSHGGSGGMSGMDGM